MVFMGRITDPNLNEIHILSPSIIIQAITTKKISSHLIFAIRKKKKKYKKFAETCV